MSEDMRGFSAYMVYIIVIAGVCGAVNYMEGSEIANVYEAIACVALARTMK